MTVFEKIVANGPEALAEVLSYLTIQITTKVYASLNVDVESYLNDDVCSELRGDYYKCLTAEYKE